MAFHRREREDQIARTLRVEITFDGADFAVGDKWELTSLEIHFAQGEQEIPAGATSPHTLIWDVVLPPAPKTANVELVKTHGAGVSPAPVLTFTMMVNLTNVVPKPAPPSVAAPQPQPQASQAINKLPWVMMGTGTLVFLALVGLVVYLLWLFSGMVASGFSAQAQPAITPSQTSVVTTVEQRVVTSDPAVALEATKASASITH